MVYVGQEEVAGSGTSYLNRTEAVNVEKVAYVCVYICVYVCVYVSVYVYVYVYVYVFVCV